MRAAPRLTPVTIPLLLTVATVASLVPHVADGVPVVPSAYVAVAVSVTVLPTGNVTAAGLTVNAEIDAVLLVNVGAVGTLSVPPQALARQRRTHHHPDTGDRR